MSTTMLTQLKFASKINIFNKLASASNCRKRARLISLETLSPKIMKLVSYNAASGNPQQRKIA